MGELSTEKREEIKQLVTAQKKAKIAWVATICQISETDLFEYAADIGLMIEGEFILIPSESKEQKTSELINMKREQIITEIVGRRYYRYNPMKEVEIGLSKFTLSDSTESLFPTIFDALSKTIYVVHTFSGQRIETSEYEALKILERMKLELRQLPNEHLRLYIPIKKYLEYLILPQLKGKIDSYEEQMFLTIAQNEDVNIFNAANNHFMTNVVDQKNKGNNVKQITFRLPAGDTCIIKGNQLLQFQNQMLEIYSFEFRKIFYERDSMIRQIMNNFL